MLDAFPKHIDDPAFGNLTLKPGKELISLGTIICDSELLDDFRLSLLKEGKELGEVDCVITVVVFRATFDIGKAAVDGGFVVD